MRTKTGTVTSAKMTGTVTVVVHSQLMHPIYKKRFRVSKKFLADTNGLDIHEGDQVTMIECRPMSKNKHFKVTEILVAAPRVDEISEEKDLDKALNRKAEQAADSTSTSNS